MNSLLDRPAALLLLVAGASLTAIGAALVSQHVFDMQPCPWCVLQRAVFAAIALVALAGAWLPRRLAKAGALLVTALLAAAGMAAALWQHLVAKSSSSCNLTLADRIISGLQLDALAPEVFAPRASCADAAVNLLGLPYEFWSLGLFAALGGAAAWTLVRLWAPGGSRRGGPSG
ncbi:MAG: disulfide bond formation protein B [Rubrivivax sp.]|jgi:disulfide bond formation protein DsbB|nr:disulfide bond formation protein B [Rubrivivax sp.]